MLFITSCENKTTEGNDSNIDSVQDDSQITDSITELETEIEELKLPEGRDEAFSDFIFTFLNNKRFQAERVKFPLQITDIDASTRMISSGQDFRKEFQVPTHEYYTMLVNDRGQLEEMQNDLELCNVIWQNIDLNNMTVASFHFSRNEGKWMLMEETKSKPEGTFADFLTFYNKFTTDSLFQQQSIAKQLRITMPDPEDEYTSIDGMIEAEQWSSFSPEMPSNHITNINFGQQIEGIKKIVFLQCGISNGMIDAYTFQRESGKWRLSSYEN